MNSTLVLSVSTLLCFLYTRQFGICLLHYGSVSVASAAQDWGENGGRDGQLLPLLAGMVSSSTHKFPSGHRSAIVKVSRAKMVENPVEQ